MCATRTGILGGATYFARVIALRTTTTELLLGGGQVPANDHKARAERRPLAMGWSRATATPAGWMTLDSVLGGPMIDE